MEGLDWSDLSKLGDGFSFNDAESGNTMDNNEESTSNADMSNVELSDWNEMKKFDDDHDDDWFKAQEKKLSEQYGGNFLKVKYCSSGRVAYFCELCLAECNAKKSLELHCNGMKHLKKKDLWEKEGKPLPSTLIAAGKDEYSRSAGKELSPEPLPPPRVRPGGRGRGGFAFNPYERSSYEGRSSYDGQPRGGGGNSYDGPPRGGGRNSYDGPPGGGGRNSYDGPPGGGGRSSYDGPPGGRGRSSYDGPPGERGRNSYDGPPGGRGRSSYDGPPGERGRSSYDGPPGGRGRSSYDGPPGGGGRGGYDRFHPAMDPYYQPFAPTPSHAVTDFHDSRPRYAERDYDPYSIDRERDRRYDDIRDRSPKRKSPVRPRYYGDSADSKDSRNRRSKERNGRSRSRSRGRDIKRRSPKERRISPDPGPVSPYKVPTAPSPPRFNVKRSSPVEMKPNLVTSPAGSLLQKLSECCVKSSDDADLAMNVVISLLKSLKEYSSSENELKITELLTEAELKVGTVKALKVGMKMLSGFADPTGTGFKKPEDFLNTLAESACQSVKTGSSQQTSIPYSSSTSAQSYGSMPYYKM